MDQMAGADRVCPNCGKVVARDRERLCNHCGEPFAGPGSPDYLDPGIAAVAGAADQLVADGPATLVRTYKGAQQADAVAKFERDAKLLAERGYVPTGQSWAQGQWGCGAFLVALVLFVILIGLLVFLYMLIVKPEGTLTVTYARAPREPAEPAPEPAGATLQERLAQLDAARDAGLISPEEHDAQRGRIIGSL